MRNVAVILACVTTAMLAGCGSSSEPTRPVVVNPQPGQTVIVPDTNPEPGTGQTVIVPETTTRTYRCPPGSICP